MLNPQIKPNKYDDQLVMMQDAATHLINEAVSLATHINDAKTNTKKSFYSKKFKKVKQDLTQTLAAVEILKQLTGASNAGITDTVNS